MRTQKTPAMQQRTDLEELNSLADSMGYGRMHDMIRRVVSRIEASDNLLSSCRAAMQESEKFYGRNGTDWSAMIAAIDAVVPRKEWAGMEIVTRSCGCVFCDVGLVPEVTAVGARPVHVMPDGRRIDCPIENNPPMSGREKSSLKSEEQ